MRLKKSLYNRVLNKIQESEVPWTAVYMMCMKITVCLWLHVYMLQKGVAVMSMDGRYSARSQEGGAVMSMDGRYSARSQEGGAVMSMDGRAENCSCIFCTSHVHVGRISQRARMSVRSFLLCCKPIFYSVTGNAACAVQVKFFHHVGAMFFNGFQANRQVFCDIFISLPFGDKLHDFTFTRG